MFQNVPSVIPTSSTRMNEDVVVHDWSCSYYMNDEKRWVSGRLSLTLSGVRFSPAPLASTGPAPLFLPLCRVTQMSVEWWCLLYSALTLQERDGPKHWFCSLKPSIGSAHLVLRHFWSERATPTAFSSASQAPPTQGQRLVAMMSDAQHRLAHTGRLLGQQGEQFHHITQDMDKMESHLGVADRYLLPLNGPITRVLHSSS